MLSIFCFGQTQLTDVAFELMDDGFGLTDFLLEAWKMTNFECIDSKQSMAMGSFLEYKNYIGSVEFSAEDNVLYGKILGISDLVNFEAASVKGLRTSFKQVVDDYLATCKELGKEPDKFFKGVFNVRTGPDRHRELALIAGKRQLKLNEVVNISFEYLIKHEEEVFGNTE